MEHLLDLENSTHRIRQLRILIRILLRIDKRKVKDFGTKDIFHKIATMRISSFHVHNLLQVENFEKDDS